VSQQSLLLPVAQPSEQLAETCDMGNDDEAGNAAVGDKGVRLLPVT